MSCLMISKDNLSLFLIPWEASDHNLEVSTTRSFVEKVASRAPFRPDPWFTSRTLQSAVDSAGVCGVARSRCGSARAAPAQPARGTPARPAASDEKRVRGAWSRGAGSRKRGFGRDSATALQTGGPDLRLREPGSTPESPRPAVGVSLSILRPSRPEKTSCKRSQGLFCLSWRWRRLSCDSLTPAPRAPPADHRGPERGDSLRPMAAASGPPTGGGHRQSRALPSEADADPKVRE
ncbi:uncharacterized protein LOC119051229 [Artibeus jamaicensis]|uniref:uncharacterized protein LOC119051229 n=1 Tax=Artibeus jamaicensis TaxID=9417 RepID=UPI00235A74EB|nr:uncharacterized protein LOC119051229 [Artibeus jamaicensis]